MENLVNFVNAVKNVQLEQVIDIVVAILVYILFRALSKSLAYTTVKIFKPTVRNRKKIKQNAFYKPLVLFYAFLGAYLGLLIIRKPTKYTRMV